MEYKNQTENRAFQEMLQAAVKRLQNRSGEDLAAKIIGSIFFPLIMNQKTFQSGFDKFVDYCLNLFPVITVIAEHQSVDGKAAIHLKIKNRFCLFKGQEAV